MSESGLLLEVRWEWDGTIAAEDTAAGATTMTVERANTLSGKEIVFWVGETGPYTLLDANVETDVITFDPPLSEDSVEGDPVVPDAGGGPGQVWVAEVLLVDPYNPIEVPLTVHDLAVMPEGIYDPPKNITISDDFQSVIDLPGNLPVISGAIIDPGTLPDPTTPTEPPVFSPSLIARGTSAGIVLATVEVVDASTLIEYHMTDSPPLDSEGNPVPFPTGPDTLIDTATRSTVKSVSTMPDGTPLDPDTTYFFRTVATNIIGDAPPGVMTAAKMDMNNIAELYAELITAGFILAGQIQVGQITIDPETGITIPQPDGGTIHLPANGVDPARITAHITARSLTMEDAASFYGTTSIFGIMRVANGVVAPTSPPTVSTTYPRVNSELANDEIVPPSLVHGMVERISNPSKWIVVRTFLDSGDFREVDKVTGALSPGFFPSTPAHFKPEGGVTSDGSFYYVLGQDFDRDGAWYVYKYNDSFAKVDEWLVVGASSLPDRPAIGVRSNGQILITFVNKSKQMQVRRYTAAGALLGTTNVASLGTAYNMGGIAWGPFDYGGFFGLTDAITVFTKGGECFTFDAANPNGGRVAFAEFSSAGGTNVAGFWWDGTRFHSVDESGRFWDYSRNWPSQSVDVVHTWYDGDAGGTGTHETDAGPKTTAAFWSRAWLTVSTPPPPDSGVIDPARLDKANQVRVYVRYTSGGTYRLVETLGIDPDGNSYVDIAPLDIMPSVGDAPPPDNEFLNAESPPGQMESTALDTNGEPLWIFRGDGYVRVPLLRESLVASSPFSGTVELAKQGRIVTASINISRASSFSTAFTPVVMIPTAFASPVEILASASPWFNSTANFQFVLRTTGELQVRMSAANSNGMGANMSWRVDDD